MTGTAATAPVTRRLVRVPTDGASGMTRKLLAKTLAEPAYACASAVSAIDLDPRTPIRDPQRAALLVQHA